MIKPLPVIRAGAYFLNMINLTKGNAAQQIIFTGTEQCLLDNPYFLFIFTSRQTNDTVSFVKANTSGYTGRYDKVTVNVNTYFSDYNAGLWSYKIYEQSSSTNINPAGLNLVEEGFMKLSPSTEFTPTEYDGQNPIFIAHGD